MLGAVGHLKGWYVELDFAGGSNLFEEWTLREESRLAQIAFDRTIPWCPPPPPPPVYTCPEWVELQDGVTYCPANISKGVHREEALCKSQDFWRDSFGDGCYTYDLNPVWCHDAHHFAVNGMGAAQACCACGGGSSYLLRHPCPLVITLVPANGGDTDEKKERPRVIFPANLTLEPTQCFTLSVMGRGKFDWQGREKELNANRGSIEPVSNGLQLSLAEGMPNVSIAFTAKPHDRIPKPVERRLHTERRSIRGTVRGAEQLEVSTGRLRRQLEGICAHKQVYRVLADPASQDGDKFCTCEPFCFGTDVRCLVSSAGRTLRFTAVKMPEDGCRPIKPDIELFVIILSAVFGFVTIVSLGYAVHIRLRRGCTMRILGTTLRVFPLAPAQAKHIQEDEDQEKAIPVNRSERSGDSVKMVLTLGILFEAAGEEESQMRKDFLTTLTSDLAHAADIPAGQISVLRLSAGSIIVDLRIAGDGDGLDAPSIALDLLRQFHDSTSRLRRGTLTRFAQASAEIGRACVKHLVCACNPERKVWCAGFLRCT